MIIKVLFLKLAWFVRPDINTDVTIIFLRGMTRVYILFISRPIHIVHRIMFVESIFDVYLILSRGGVC